MANRDYHDRQAIAGSQDMAAKDYWKQQLSGEIQKSSFPYDFRKTGKEGYDWDKVALDFSRELEAKLISASKESDHALHVILTAGLAILLDKYRSGTNKDKDIVIGSPIYRQENEGEFINTLLPFRIEMDDKLTFRDFLQRVKQVVLTAVKHHNYPVEMLIQRLDLSPAPLSPGQDRDFPLFDAAILLDNIHDRDYIQHINVNTLFCFSRDGGVVAGELEYNTLRYEKTTIEQIARHLPVLLEKVLLNAGLELFKIEILTESEKKQILVEFNSTEAEYPADKTLPGLFVEQVEKNADATAVEGSKIGAEERLLIPETYGELQRSSDQLAQVLRNKGIKPGAIVGLIVERSVEMAAGILAVLKAGGAYLPIEPGYPEDRISYMLEDSRAALLLTSRRLYEIGLEERCGKPLAIETVFLEDPYIGKCLPPEAVAPTDLAYVIYTSGTTGKPKGVMVEHRSVVNFIHWRLGAYGITGKDVTLLLLSYAFDAFGSNFYSSLLSGGMLVMIPESKKFDYDYIKEVIKEKEVTNAALVPGMYEALLSRCEAEDLESMRFIILGGEKAGANLIEKSRSKNSRLTHIVEYGPTEATIGSTVNIGISPQETTIIGKPIANTGIYVLDHFLQPQPVGVPGELYIGGTGLARGYLNNPELTAEKFVQGAAQPSSESHIDQPSQITPPQQSPLTLYRTGDLARWLPDGRIEFLGRLDRQVKIRGFRVEIGEIETLLNRHKDIEQCVVLTRETSAESERDLVAYYIKSKQSVSCKGSNNVELEEETGGFSTDGDTEECCITSLEIRKFLGAELPDYMVPSFLVELDEFPMTPTGKIDKKALAARKDLHSERELVEPGNEIEERILEVWKQVLGTDELGIENGFFDSGGNSMKAMAAVSQLSKEFSITIDHIYKYGTVAEISQNVGWQKDSLKNRIEAIRLSLREGREQTESGKEAAASMREEMEKEYRAYTEQVKKEKLPSLKANRKYRHILLTGGTGFLGSHLIYELLEVTGAELYLVVRGDSPGHAEERLSKRLAFYFGEDFYASNKERLRVVHGDIRGEKLGIEDSLYEELAGKLDGIVHSAADVRQFGMYDDFYKVNVEGTENLLKLAAAGKKIIFHYISTLGVSGGNIEGRSFIIFNEYCCDVGQQQDNVYSRTKLEAEKKVLSYREKGIDASIYRLGNLIAHSQTGKFQENIEGDAFYGQMKGFVTIGMVPNLSGMNFDLSFIDHITTSIVILMTRKNLMNGTYHLWNTNNLSWYNFVPLLNKAGIDIEAVGIEKFLDNLQEQIGKADNQYMEVIAHLLLHAGLFQEKSDILTKTTATNVVSFRTEFILRKLGFEWLKANESNIVKMIGHCKQVGFLE
ncbi:MAG: amino acid adenylation domain-containing protein [Candidatus Aminicenantes bacterium]|nr:amino acid adenylation domain-containing protein [Candidatus Aminicenantes bacterium]